ncbi:unnamed protein product [Urochloa humidicola]
MDTGEISHIDPGEEQQYSRHQEREKNRITVGLHQHLWWWVLNQEGSVARSCAGEGAVQPLAQARTLSSNKENVPPVGVLIAPKRRSPLPDWYLRTPLRDITSIVKSSMVDEIRGAKSCQLLMRNCLLNMKERGLTE